MGFSVGLYFLIRGLYSLIRVYEFILIARALISWFPVGGLGGVSELLYAVTEPVLKPFRELLRKIPAIGDLPIDLSVIVVLFLLYLLRLWIMAL